MEEVTITKTDEELIQERINELQKNLKTKHLSGKTYRAINKCIEDLFEKPIGSQIYLDDDPSVGTDNDLLSEFIKKFVIRMQHDFPNTRFKIQYPSPGIAFAIRTTETYEETATRRIKQWQKKLEEMKK